MRSAEGESEPASPKARFIQGLAGKSLETVRLTEMLGVRPNDGSARALLAQHLRELSDEAAELDFVHLESALGTALTRMERDAFSPASLVSVRVLACRYESLASMPSRSGTHPVVSEEAAEPSLQGKQVLVADDDAEVRWFYVGILREAGARVTEARDGVEALELARTEPPDVILADIVMPRLDGLELCAAVRREPGLDGVPVVLLSWRDDFLHRTRELRAGAQGYLRKELPARQILSRVSSVLEPLTDLERALGLGGESRGDLEDVGVSRLLRATRRLRPDASIVLQDPWSLFEIEMRDGHLVRLTRTAIDGAFTQGAEALPALVGMSSGRFVIVRRGPGADLAESDVLDDGFADATLHLAKMMNALADDPDCRVSFDEDVLGAYVRHSPIGVQRLIARLVDGEPPRALWQSGAGTRSLVDALLITLARQGAIREVVQTQPDLDEQPVEAEVPIGGQLNGPQIRQDSGPVADPIERENLRAQSALAMFGQPANRGPRSAHPIWRLGAGAGPGDETLSRFETELRRKPRLLGFAFIVLLLATTGLLIWRELSPPPAAAPPPVATPAPIEVDQAEAVAAEEQGVDARRPRTEEPWSRFAGTLKEGVDASLGVSEGQGVLQIDGTSGVRIKVDGIDRGSLPAAIVLDEGRHTVRFETDARSTIRFYYVKAGATRVLRAVTRPGGFVDPR